MMGEDIHQDSVATRWGRLWQGLCAIAARFDHRLYALAVVAVVVIHFLHLVSLPVAISYDGHMYIDMADVLGSPRFPQDWLRGRTPLFPLLLKGAFALLGRQPLAILTLVVGMGLIGTLALGAALRRCAGPRVAAGGMILISLFPSLVAYEHFVLTEAGVFCFTALILWVLSWRPTSLAQWCGEALALAALFTAGYCFRQTLLTLLPLAALAYVVGAWQWLRESRPPAARGVRTWRLVAMGLSAALLVAAPWLAARTWRAHSDDQVATEVTLAQGLVRQKLLPLDHPLLGEHRAAYCAAIEQSRYRGNFYSGMRADLMVDILQRLTPVLSGRCQQIFAECVWRYPGRYFDGMGRTLTLFCGAKGLQSEAENACHCTLYPRWLESDNKVCEGPPAVDSLFRQQFAQRTSPSAVMRMFWNLRSVYAWILPLAMGLAFAGLLAGLALRSRSLLLIYGVALSGLGPYVLMLSSIDRYAVPFQAVAIGAIGLLPVELIRAWRRRKQGPAGSQEGLRSAGRVVPAPYSCAFSLPAAKTVLVRPENELR